MRGIRSTLAVAMVIAFVTGCQGDTGPEQQTDHASDSAVPGDGTPEGAGGLPGGVSGVDLLEERGYLDDEGRMYGPQASLPDGDERNLAFCAYLFGEPGEVGTVAELPGEVSLDKGSGFRVLGGNGTGYECLYLADGEPALALILWDRPREGLESSEVDAVVVEVPPSHHGYAVYDDEFDGSRMSEDTATTWLTEAAERVWTP